MRGLKLMWGLLWPFLWFLAALGAAAFSCPHSFSVLEVTGIGAAAAILTLLAWERLQKGKGLTDRLFGEERPWAAVGFSSLRGSRYALRLTAY